MVGDGELLHELRRDYRACANITFLGQLPQEQLIAQYRSATAVVLPSLAPETFGLTVVEAFACGAPAIVRAAGGNRETIDNTGAGFVYSNEQELLQAVRSLATDTALRAQLGLQARAAYEAHYTEDTHVSRYLELAESMLKNKSDLIAGEIG